MDHLLDKTVAIILGGGVGSRLYPLTAERSKPAVPIAGKYRLIDIPISNCLNSNINRIFVLTQYNSASLNRHVKNTYQFDRFSNGFVDILAAEQTRTNLNWFQGTADAVRQVLPRLSEDYENILILSGDQLYQMDFEEILNYHLEKDADLTVATIPVVKKDAVSFGILKVKEGGNIIDFTEKPSHDQVENWRSVVDEKYFKEDKHYLASMGIYVFKKSVIYDLFEKNPNAVDFGKEIIPYAVENDMPVYSFPFGGYWTDIGNISSFFEANLSLSGYLPEFHLFDNSRPIYSRARMLSPSKFFGTQLNETLISDGCIIHATLIDKAVIGIRARIGKHTVIKSVIVMGNDYYQTVNQMTELQKPNLLGIGEHCYIENAIIDKNVKIADHVTIRGGEGLPDEETELYSIREGIVIVKKGAYIPSGMTIGYPL